MVGVIVTVIGSIVLLWLTSTFGILNPQHRSEALPIVQSLTIEPLHAGKKSLGHLTFYNDGDTGANCYPLIYGSDINVKIDVDWQYVFVGPRQNADLNFQVATQSVQSDGTMQIFARVSCNSGIGQECIGGAPPTYCFITSREYGTFVQTFAS